MRRPIVSVRPIGRASVRGSIAGLVSLFVLVVPAAAGAAQPENEARPPVTTPQPAEPPVAPATAPTPPPPTAEETAAREAAAKAGAPVICEEASERTLKGHVFQFPGFVESAVVTTYFGLRLRLGFQEVNDLPTAIGNINISATTLAETVDVSFKITDWLALVGVAGVRSLISSNLRSLVYSGITFDPGAGGGVVVRVLRSERTGSQLSLRALGSYSSGSVSTLLPIFDRPVLSVAELIQGDLGSSMKTPFSTLVYEGSVAFAQGFSRLFGLQASASLGGSRFTLEPYDRIRKVRDTTTTHDVTYAVGVAPSVDFDALGLAIAVMPEYVLSRRASDAQLRGSGSFDTQHLLALGVYYSGRPNLQLGLRWSTQLGIAPFEAPLGRSAVPMLNASELVLRYVW